MTKQEIRKASNETLRTRIASVWRWPAIDPHGTELDILATERDRRINAGTWDGRLSVSAE